MALLWIVLFAAASAASSLDLSRVVFVILSQSNRRHADIARETKTILRQSLVRAGVPGSKPPKRGLPDGIFSNRKS
jgi:hypothetical protein